MICDITKTPYWRYHKPTVSGTESKQGATEKTFQAHKIVKLEKRDTVQRQI